VDLARRSVQPRTATRNCKHGLTRQGFGFVRKGVQNERSSRLCLIGSWGVVNEAGARRRRKGRSVNEEEGRGHSGSLFPLDWILRVTGVHEARDHGPRSVVKGQSAKRNKGPGVGMRRRQRRLGRIGKHPGTDELHGGHPPEASFLCNRRRKA